MQIGIPTFKTGWGFRSLVALCTALVLLAGTLAAHAEWHQSLHAHHPGSSGLTSGSLTANTTPDHHSKEGDSDEANCPVCAFAHFQVLVGLTVPAWDRVPTGWTWSERIESSVARLGAFWPEPAGRAPPASAASR